MPDDLLSRARALLEDTGLVRFQGEADLINELIAEIERLRPLAELWDAIDALMPTTASAIRKTVGSEKVRDA